MPTPHFIGLAHLLLAGAEAVLGETRSPLALDDTERATLERALLRRRGFEAA
jgi:hypothetical protein